MTIDEITNPQVIHILGVDYTENTTDNTLVSGNNTISTISTIDNSVVVLTDNTNTNTYNLLTYTTGDNLSWRDIADR